MLNTNLNKFNYFNFNDSNLVSLTNSNSLYFYSIPTNKLYYPEPFISTGNSIHYDFWFLHITIYQYWLWFFFIFLIIFFLITFLLLLKNSNNRVNPQRETRGVSRSKCGDLITACVPISWATSIIIHETTDAIDFYDGFGTSEIAIGIRAFQWGWEYYYPKTIDLNYKVKNISSFFLGKSLFNKTYRQINSEKNIFIEHFKIKKNSDESVIPFYLTNLSLGKDDIFNYNSKKVFGFSKLGKKDNSFLNSKNAMYTNNSLFLNSNLYNYNIFFNNLIISNFNNTENNIQYLPNISINQLSNLSKSSVFNNNYNNIFYKSFKKFLNLNYNTNNLNFNINENILYFNKFLYNNFLFNFLTLFKKNNNFTFYINNKFDNFDNIFEIVFLFYKNNFKFNYFTKKNNYISIFEKNYNYILNLYKQNNYIKKFTKNKLDYVNQNDRHFINFIKNKPYYNIWKITNQFLIENNTITSNINDFNSNFFKNIYINFNLNLININQLFWFKNSIINRTIIFKNFKTTNQDYINYNFFKFNNSNFYTDNIKNENIDNNSLNDYYYIFIKKTYKNIKLNLENSLFSYKILNKWYMPSWFGDSDFKKKINNEILFDIYWDNYFNLENFDKNNIYIYDNLNKKININYKNLNIKLLLQNNNNFIFNDSFLINFKFFNIYKLQLLYSLNDLNNSLIELFNSYKNILIFINKFNIYKFFIKNFNFDILNDKELLVNYFSDSDISSTLSSFDICNKLLKYNFDNFKLDSSNSLLDSSKLLIKLENSYNSFSRGIIHEQRSFILYNNFINSYYKIPFVNLNTKKFKDVVNKNKIFYFRNNFYFNKIINNWNINNIKLFNSFLLNTEIPFSISNESDILKYIWIDWYSNYNLLKINYIDLNKYSLSGFLKYNLKYDFFTNQLSNKKYPNYLEKEKYISKLIHYRKNYMSYWNNIPILINKLKYNRNNKFELYLNNFNNLNIISKKKNLNNINEFFLSNSKFYNFKLNVLIYNWYSNSINKNNNSELNLLSFSNILTPTRNYWKSFYSVSNYFYFINTLSDILTKREYIVKQLLYNYNINNNIPLNYKFNFNNYIFLEWKSLFCNFNIYNINIDLYKNKNILNCFYSINTNFILYNKYMNIILKDYNFIGNYIGRRLLFLNNNKTLNNIFFSEYNFILNYFNNRKKNNLLVILYNINQNNINLISTNFYFLQPLFYKITVNFKNIYNSTNINLFDYKLFYNSLLFKKTQYKHMRKNIYNMIRLQTNKAVSMPIETRIQLLTFSKDIIHSWAIPSAGIKIDCIPGFSSHKITIFFLSGIYWGQCMEICGRYHHWMPIVVYFLKRDLFLLWCTYFISKDKKIKTYSKQINSTLNNNSNYVSYSLNSWKLEL